MRKKLYGLLFSALPVWGVAQQGPFQTDERTESRIDSLLQLMTLEEKVGQMVQYSGGFELTGSPSDLDANAKVEKLKNGEVGSMLNVLGTEATREAQELVMTHSRLKIPLLFGYDVIHGYKTMFPIPLGETASWDTTLVRQSARVAARETAASGVHWTFAPMLDVSRDARWGRIMEGAGEDPFLTAVMGVARIKGYQGADLSDPLTIAACAKHFAGYGFAEAGRDYNTIHVGMGELHNQILPPFKAAVDAGVATFMNSFNEIDGIPATAHVYLQRELLKGKWGFNGFTVSDWASIAELITHGYAANKNEAGEMALAAGSDMDMEGRVYEMSLSKAVTEGSLQESTLDDAVRRILRVKFALGLFDNPYKYIDAEREKKVLSDPSHRELAFEVAKASMVLLKNEGSILPLSRDLKRIAVVGPLADDKDTPLGNWRAQAVPNSAVSVKEGLEKAVSGRTKINYAKGANLGVGERGFLMPLKINETDTSGFAGAVEAARLSEVVVMVLGEDAYQSGEGRSQTDIRLAGVQQELLEAVYKANPNIVLVLMNGRPLDLSEVLPYTKAVVEAWLPGSEGGNAVAEILFGAYNPSGKLPVSFPRHVGQEPMYYNQKNTGRPSNDLHVTYSGYTDSEKTPLFPFGFGLSYTTFSYGKPTVSSSEIKMNESLTVSVQITNTGSRAGKEVVQLYIRDLVGSRTRPVKELKDFALVSLEPGETRTVSFTLDKEDVAFYTARNTWEAEPGQFDVFVGGNSATTNSETFTLVP